MASNFSLKVAVGMEDTQRFTASGGVQTSKASY